MIKYNHSERIHLHGLESSDRLASVIYDFVKPKSVIDVGCGTGNFLQSFQRLGVEDILGLDGNWVEPAIRKQFLRDEHFLATDLTSPQDIGRKFDIAICLEVAEHLQETAADPLVNFLTSLSDVVVFSAAIPRQPGHHHITCQWQSEWAIRFKALGFRTFDCFRPVIWNDNRIPYWYRQNIFMALSPGSELVIQRPLPHTTDVSAIVHPDLYTETYQQTDALLNGDWPLRTYLSCLGKCVCKLVGLR